MLKFALFKIKEGKREDWRNWCTELMRRKNEALKTLKQENSSREICILHGDYVFGISEYFAEPQPTDMSIELNIEHRQRLRDCLEKVEHEITYDIGA